MIQKCTNSKTPSQINDAIENLRLFTQRLSLSADPNHQFGYLIDDLSYINQVKKDIELPDLLKGSEFLVNISSPATYSKAYKMIADLNKTLPEDKQWTVLIYKSRFLTTPDESQTFGRFFVLVPENGYDKWIQFGIILPDGDQTKKVNNLSIVSVAPPDEQGRRFNAIIDWWRSYDNNSVSLTLRRISQNESETCVMCHKTSPLGIHPAQEYLFDPAGHLVPNTISAGVIPDRLNTKIEDYGPPYYRGWVDTGDYGPTIGPKKMRTDDFMKACIGSNAQNVPGRQLSLQSTSLDKIRQAMNCSKCHNATDMGLLNFPEALRKPAGAMDQIHEYLSQGWMPPEHPDMTASEIAALNNCLTQEYYDVNSGQGLLLDWLANKK
jgi:hypothetical protein